MKKLKTTSLLLLASSFVFLSADMESCEEEAKEASEVRVPIENYVFYEREVNIPQELNDTTVTFSETFKFENSDVEQYREDIDRIELDNVIFVALDMPKAYADDYMYNGSAQLRFIFPNLSSNVYDLNVTFDEASSYVRLSSDFDPSYSHASWVDNGEPNYTSRWWSLEVPLSTEEVNGLKNRLLESGSVEVKLEGTHFNTPINYTAKFFINGEIVASVL